jgi:hypothetical protein
VDGTTLPTVAAALLSNFNPVNPNFNLVISGSDESVGPGTPRPTPSTGFYP